MILDFRFWILDYSAIANLPLLYHFVRKSLQGTSFPFFLSINQIELILDQSKIQNLKCSDASALRRSASVVRDRRRVADRSHANARLCDRTDRRLAASARSFHTNFHFTHPGFSCFPGRFAGGLLSRERSSLSRPAKSASSRRRLGHKISLRVSDRDQRVVEGSRNVNDTKRNVLPLFLLKSLFLCSCFCHIQWSVTGGQWPVMHLITARCPLSLISFRVPSSSRRPLFSGPFVCVRSSMCAVREREGCGGDASRGSSRCPSVA